jgi:outer membrane lipoprotein-sorting protein
MQKTVLLGAVVALLALPAVAEDLTLDQVLANHYEALGGLDAIKGMDTATFVGRMAMGPGAEAPFKMFFKRPMMARMEFTMQGMTGIQAYDGETAWMIMPFMGKSDPEVMAEDQAKNMQEQADIDGPLVDWQDKGHKVELIGLEDVDGTEAYKIRVDLANGDVRYHYLDSEYFITIKQEGKTTMQGNEVEFEAILSDYKEVGGLMFPHSVESKPKGAPAGQVITIDEIEVGIEVSDDLFAMPAPVEEVAE